MFNKVSKSVLLFVFSVSISALAQEGDFTKHKEEVLKRADERIAALQAHKTCVTAAADKEALKKCHETMRESHKEMKHDALEKRRNRIDKRLKKMDESK